MRDLLVTDLALGALSSFLDPALAGPTGPAPHPTLPCAVAAVGSDKSGALALLRRGVAPAVVTAIPQEKVHGTWALRHADGGGGCAGPEGHHAFLLLSLEGRHTQAFDARGDTLEDITGKVGRSWVDRGRGAGGPGAEGSAVGQGRVLGPSRASTAHPASPLDTPHPPPPAPFASRASSPPRPLSPPARCSHAPRRRRCGR
jgi:hypothetical protein